MDYGTITLRRATRDDLNGILDLLATRTAEELKQMRWFPEPFHSQLLVQQLTQKRLFVAVNEANGAIVSLRKVFIVDDQDELEKLLVQDLRCAHAQRELIECGFFDGNAEFFSREQEHFRAHQQILYIHVSSLFTHHVYRGRRISKFLSSYSYEQVREEIYHKVRVHNHTAIALIYALVQGNEWRTRHVVQQFFPFAQSISKELGLKPAEKISFYAYKRVKPEFIIFPSGELVQLPDEQCPAALGCVLLYELR